ncbi:MAG: ribonuclease H-like domain-containing protein [Patescibacteria group bacterium]
MALIFDIETVGENYDKLDSTTKDSLTRWIKRETQNEKEYETALEDLKNGLGFSPLTGEIVAIGVLDSEEDKGGVYYQSPGEKKEESDEGGIKLKPMSEKEMLEQFWKLCEKYQEFVSFNGMGFDVPFLMVRSAIHNIRPSKNLMSHKYIGSQKYDSKHIDLLDQLSFYGAMRRRGNLHLWCRAFGIKSPKAEGITGDDVGKLFKEKKYLEIAKYNVGDIKATRELYRYWRDYLRF